MFNYNGKIMGIVGAILTIAAFVGVLTGANNYVAKSSELIEVSERLTKHELLVERAAVQEYIWDVEREFRAMYIEEYGERPTLEQLDGYIEDVDPDTSEIYREAKLRLEEIDEELEKLNKD